MAWSWPGLRPAAVAAVVGLGSAVTAYTRITTPVSHASWPLGDCGCACGWGYDSRAKAIVCGRVGAWGAEGGVKAGAAALLWLRLLSLLYYV